MVSVEFENYLRVALFYDSPLPFAPQRALVSSTYEDRRSEDVKVVAGSAVLWLYYD